MKTVDQTVAATLTGIAVNFVGEGGESISVHLNQTDRGLTDTQAIEKAKSVMMEVATFPLEPNENTIEAAPQSPDIGEQDESATSRSFSPID